MIKAKNLISWAKMSRVYDDVGVGYWLVAIY
jgi:hypothetical protein